MLLRPAAADRRVPEQNRVPLAELQAKGKRHPITLLGQQGMDQWQCPASSVQRPLEENPAADSRQAGCLCLSVDRSLHRQHQECGSLEQESELESQCKDGAVRPFPRSCIRDGTSVYALCTAVHGAAHGEGLAAGFGPLSS